MGRTSVTRRHREANPEQNHWPEGVTNRGESLSDPRIHAVHVERTHHQQNEQHSTRDPSRSHQHRMYLYFLVVVEGKKAEKDADQVGTQVWQRMVVNSIEMHQSLFVCEVSKRQTLVHQRINMKPSTLRNLSDLAALDAHRGCCEECERKKCQKDHQSESFTVAWHHKHQQRDDEKLELERDVPSPETAL